MMKSEVPFMSLLFLIQHHHLVGNLLTLLLFIFQSGFGGQSLVFPHAPLLLVIDVAVVVRSLPEALWAFSGVANNVP